MPGGSDNPPIREQFHYQDRLECHGDSVSATSINPIAQVFQSVSQTVKLMGVFPNDVANVVDEWTHLSYCKKYDFIILLIISDDFSYLLVFDQFV
jgi:hypothetical protein